MPAKKDWLKNKTLVLEQNTFHKDLIKWIESNSDYSIIDKSVRVNGAAKKLGTLINFNFDVSNMFITIKLGKTADDLGYDLSEYTTVSICESKQNHKTFLVVYTR